MDGPLVSVIVPVYNVAPYLKECVVSVQAQTYTNLQIILVDDGSTDGSGELCDTLAKEDARIEVIHKENGGLGSARNAGLEVSKGVYIYFIDSDDWVDATMVEKTLIPVERDGYDQCVYGMTITGEEGLNCYVGRWEPLSLCFSTPEEKQRFLCRWLLPCRISWSVTNRVHRRDLIEENGLRFQNEREIGAEDLDFTFRYLAACQTFKMYYLPESLYCYRHRNGSIMRTNAMETFMVRELRLLRRQEEMLSGQELFRPMYIYGGVTLSLYLSTYIEETHDNQGFIKVRAFFQNAEDWDYLEKQARLARENRKGILRACGPLWGRRVCAFYQYMLDGKPGPLCRYIRLRQWYEQLRGIKAQLHRH